MSFTHTHEGIPCSNQNCALPADTTALPWDTASAEQVLKDIQDFKREAYEAHHRRTSSTEPLAVCPYDNGCSTHCIMPLHCSGPKLVKDLEVDP